MILTIKLQNQMDCGYICHKIQEAISKYQKENNSPDLTDCLLVINVKKPTDDNNLIPKLENKTCTDSQPVV
jgi:hypothetical protein